LIENGRFEESGLRLKIFYIFEESGLEPLIHKENIRIWIIAE